MERGKQTAQIMQIVRPQIVLVLVPVIADALLKRNKICLEKLMILSQ